MLSGQIGVGCGQSGVEIITTASSQKRQLEASLFCFAARERVASSSHL